MLSRLINQFRVYRSILDHPLNRGRRAAATRRWLLWHLSSRLAPGPIAVPFVDHTALLAGPGMSGLTTNIYCGLAELPDMGFVLHALRPADLFLDVGANAGVYTVLASGVVGARSIAIEPLPATFGVLQRNLALNGLSASAQALNAAVGEHPGTVRFTTRWDTTNHVLAPGEQAEHCEVPLVTLDDALAGQDATLIKIDIEGYEMPALRGARRLLDAPTLKAVVIELNHSGDRYGFDDRDTAGLLSRHGFVPVSYDPLHRLLLRRDGTDGDGNNTIFVRDPDAMQALLRAAPARRIANGPIL